ncbi:ewing's tumor-associated antigen 1 [Bombina bombina]|uniref:ewing's tumor-associated antigen 1 n=1 Tax=Bombina bombina TaxID=8345 RepID=UPI00235A507B|nr:ewing's tumor-associated antigen 1 [Bombina bombina]
MMSRRRLQAEKSRGQDDEDRNRRKEKRGGLDRETPKKSKSEKKLSRSLKSGAASPDIPVVPGKSTIIEEAGTNKITPKRLSKGSQWVSSFNSPSNDVEQQQEIFWDPHSPAPLRIDNGNKKRAAGKCTVDISDIVNRIAPKDEKPTNSDSVILGMWIGEDAIPSTPAIVRARTKLNRSRVKQTDEELMQLAKQFDRNLVENHLSVSDNVTENVENVQNNDFESFLDDIPEEDAALDLKSASQSSAVSSSAHHQLGSQKSVDQEAEAALNALFDSSTQKCSGRLSPSSDVSSNSVQNIMIADTMEKTLPCHKGLVNHPTHRSQSNPCAKLNSEFHTPQRDTFILPKDISKNKEPPGLSNTMATVSNSPDDFEDEWDTDILEDDSFVMQVTQNPELIATPKQDIPNTKLHCMVPNPSISLRDNDKTNAEKQSVTSSFPSKLQSFKFVSRKVNESEKDAKLNINHNGENLNIVHQNVNATVNVSSKNVPKPFSNTVTQISLKPQQHFGGHNMEKHNRNLSERTSFILENSKHTSSNADVSLQPCSSVQKNNKLIKSFGKVSPQNPNPVDAGNKGSVHHEEWDDPKFSDEILDMFCDSDSLWEANEEDDDLLYQVCDDVERYTQTQVVNNENKIENTQGPALSSLKNDVNKNVRKINQGSSNEQFWLNKNGSHSIPSTTTSAVSNKFKGNAVHYNRTTNQPLTASAAAISHQGESSSYTIQNDCLQRVSQVPFKFNRSNSVPASGECNNKPMSNNSKLHSLSNPQSSTLFPKNSAATSKFSFTKIKNSQVSSSGTNTASQSNYQNMHRQDLDVNQRNTSISSRHPSKRHLSESMLQATKVFVAEEKNTRCSLEEIERKKQEALERRKMKARAFSYDTAPT